jgi:hypothetical protein
MSQCIGTGCSKITPERKHLLSPSFVYDGFFLDPDAKYDGNWHADAFIKGAPKITKLAELKFNPIHGNTEMITNVSFGSQYAVLYDISGPGKPLCIGFEVLFDPGNTIKPDKYTGPNPKDFPYYCQVITSGKLYHVVLANRN